MTETVHRMLPLYEAKMIHHYDHRWATYERDGTIRDVTLAEKQDADFAALPRYWVREGVVRDQLDDLDSDALLGFRDICRATDERTVISTRFPYSAVGNKIPLILECEHPRRLVAVLSSFVLDFAARQKVGGTTLNFFIAKQLPTLAPGVFDQRCPWSWRDSLGEWIDIRAEKLMMSWDLDVRESLRAELDAAMFHLFGIPRDDVGYIMDTFPIVKRKDEAEHGEYRTKRLILEQFDRLTFESDEMDGTRVDQEGIDRGRSR